MRPCECLFVFIGSASVPKKKSIAIFASFPGYLALLAQPAHLWANSDFVPRSKALGTPWTVGVM